MLQSEDLGLAFQASVVRFRMSHVHQADSMLCAQICLEAATKVRQFGQAVDESVPMSVIHVVHQ